LKIISLGWGIQSFTLAAMVALGELEQVDAAIHADTTHERSATYEFAKRWTPWLEVHGVKVVIVNDAKQAQTVTTFKTDIPAFTATLSANGGMLRRQCTQRWKIYPMRRWIGEELRRTNLTRRPGVVEQWIGISLDEAERMKQSDVAYIIHRWPLIEHRMTRNDCARWLERHDLPIPTKSSCVFCPFHSRSAWLDMKAKGGQDWKNAIAVDEMIRDARPPFSLFVHPDRIPLVGIKSQQDNGQLELWSEECSGICGI